MSASILLCAICVLAPMAAAMYMIWKHKHDDEREEGWNRVWSPCIQRIPLSFLMIFRIIAFFLLVLAIIFDVIVHGADMFYFYTQWTFMLVTIYFLFGSLLSVYGWYLHRKINNVAYKYPESGELVNKKNMSKRPRFLVCVARVYEILFQVTAGAVMLTDVLYWCIIFPFLTIRNYKSSFVTVVAHSLNLVLFLGDVALNKMPLPWHRISYFILWTGFYVVFQWIVHACVSLWWPYPFLDPTMSHAAPFWYLVLLLMHLPCYGLLVLIVKLKENMLAKWFPH